MEPMTHLAARKHPIKLKARHGRLPRLSVLTVLLAALAGALSLGAQEPAQGDAPGELHVLVGRSLVINSPAPIIRVSIANPAIADALVVSPTQVQINGKLPGAVSLVLWYENEQTQTFDLFVDLDILATTQNIREVFPDEPVRIDATKEIVTVSGRVSSKPVADKIVAVLTAAAPKVVSLLEIQEPPAAGEVMLQVRFAEVNRGALSELGFNFLSFPGSPLNVFGSTSTQQFGPPQLEDQLNENTFGLSDLLNVFVFRPDVQIGATIKALEQRNLLQILAEPNLITQTGKEASFLAGGEFPVPILQGANAQGITITYKEFGVRLTFTPTILNNGKIHLKVTPEVSALDFANAVTISGFVIPAFSTRRVVTEMDLSDGQSFAIAGLVDDRLTNTARKMPLLGDIPLLGKLFQSRSKNRAKTELMVVVTPRVVHVQPNDPLPPGPEFPERFLPPAGPQNSGARP